MPIVAITYDEADITNLIQNDMKNRYGLFVSDNDIYPSVSVEYEWTVHVEQGKLDASKSEIR